MAGFSEAEITEQLKEVPGWAYEDGQITRTFSFDGFLKGIEFVVKVAHEAEKADHHPDIDIRYSDIKIAVSSHDVGGITDRDFKLADAVSKLV